MTLNRRTFFYTTAWGGVIGMAAPRLFAANPKQSGAPILVVIQLAGGNDGLNTIVPIGNDHYYRARPNIAIRPAEAIRLNADTGLHPGLEGWKALYDEGRLAIVEGVGYPNPNLSHFRSTEIWHTASDTGQSETPGWLGHHFDTYCPRKHAGSPETQAILDRTASRTPFPDTRLAKELHVVSQLIQGGMPTQVYHLSRGGFDTHTNQTNAHAALMKEIGGAMQAFQTELEATGNAGRVAVLAYSEFGRRVKENASGGTDHGVAAPVYVMGGSVIGGLHGQRPGLAPAELVQGGLAHTVDFRSVYATLLEKHLGVDSAPVLLRKFQTLEFI